MKNLYTTPEPTEAPEVVNTPLPADVVNEILDQHTDTPKKDNTMINLVIIALVIAVVIGLLVYYVKKRNEITA